MFGFLSDRELGVTLARRRSSIAALISCGYEFRVAVKRFEDLAGQQKIFSAESGVCLEVQMQSQWIGFQSEVLRQLRAVWKRLGNTQKHTV